MGAMASLGSNLENSSRQFFGWWGRELLTFAPTRLARKFSKSARETVLIPDVEFFEQADDVALQANNERGESLVVCLPDARLHLVRRNFPLLSRKELGSAIELQIERLLPLKRSEVAVDWRELARDRASSQVEVEIALVTLADLDKVKRALGDGVDDLERIEGRSGGVSFTFWRKAAGDRSKLRLNILLATMALLLLILAVSSAESRRAEKLELWQAHLGDVQTRAVEARSLATEVRQLKAQIAGIDTHRNGADLRALLAVMSDQLSDEIWLASLTMQGDTLRLEGYGRDGPQVRTALQSIGPFDNIRSVATESKPAQGGKAFFDLEMTLAKGGVDAP